MKALLVIDVNDDENIEELRVSYKIDLHDEVLYAADNEKLKLVPEKYNRVEQLDVFSECFADGYNACIDKILGEEE